MNNYQVLLVDDDGLVLQGLSLFLGDDYSLLEVTSGEAAIEAVKSRDDIAVVVMDIKMPGMSGIEAARIIRETKPDLPVIFHTGFSGEFDEDRIDAAEKPFEYVQKGGASSQLLRAVRNAYRSFELKRDASMLAEMAETSFGMIGRSQAMRDVYQLIRKVARTDAKVMIRGETGTGKGLAAEAIYRCSHRADRLFKKFNCNHTPTDLVESQLFGHTKGAFSGAHADRVGLFEFADGGTLFLDEIGDLSIDSQGKLLQVLDEGRYDPLGWTGESRKCNVRVICATNRDLEAKVEKGEFRLDLYERLSGHQIVMPPLRDRKEDIPLLVDHFADYYAEQYEKPLIYFDSSARRVLIEQDWPRNVRQLQHTVEAIVGIADSDIIIARDVEECLEIKGQLLHVGGNGNGTSYRSRVDEARKAIIRDSLAESEGNVNATARLLQMDPGNLRALMKRLNVRAD